MPQGYFPTRSLRRGYRVLYGDTWVRRHVNFVRPGRTTRRGGRSYLSYAPANALADHQAIRNELAEYRQLQEYNRRRGAHTYVSSLPTLTQQSLFWVAHAAALARRRSLVDRRRFRRSGALTDTRLPSDVVNHVMSFL